MGIKSKFEEFRGYLSVQKAKFTFIEVDSAGKKVKKGLGSSGNSINYNQYTYQVPINPSEISKSFSASLERINNLTKDDNNGRMDFIKVREVKTKMSMNLIFDLVEEYGALPSRVKSMYRGIKNKGFLSGLAQGDSGLEKSIDICNDPLYKIIVQTQTKEKKMYVIFEWGAITISGYIESFSPSFTYFSDQGVPLRMEASISIVEAQEPSDSEGETSVLSDVNANASDFNEDNGGELTNEELQAISPL